MKNFETQVVKINEAVKKQEALVKGKGEAGQRHHKNPSLRMIFGKW